MKCLHLLWTWLKNIIVFGKPAFSRLDYADYIAEGKSYFVFSWSLKHAYRIKIKSAAFSSLLKSGSAYIAIDEERPELEITICGVWRSRNYFVKLKRISINSPIEFPATMKNGFEIKLILPVPELNFTKLKVETFKVNIVDRRHIKSIINISYPN